MQDQSKPSTNESTQLDTNNDESQTREETGVGAEDVDVSGKLAGNKDDFAGELDSQRPKPVPGADPENAVCPPPLEETERSRQP